MTSGICILTFITSNLLGTGPRDWGRLAVNINRAYANERGYRFILYQNPLQPVTAPVNWSPPMAAYDLLRSDKNCSYVLSLDGDAVVNNFDVAIEKIVEDHMPPHIDVLFTCHYTQGDSTGVCHNCQCTRDTPKGTCDYLAEFERASNCGINMGVFLVRNNRHGRELLSWWANAGNGTCNWSGGTRVERKWNLQAQACSNKMKWLHPDRIRVVGARVMNTPSFYSPKTRVAKFVQNAGLGHNSQCFRAKKDFICHTLGVRGGEGRDRRIIFASHIRNYVSRRKRQ